MERQYYVYIMANKRNGTLYVGVTNNLAFRVSQHKQSLVRSFTEKYKVHHLVYYEIHNHVSDAIMREKQIKKWERRWKLELIENMNPRWRDLYEEVAASF